MPDQTSDWIELPAPTLPPAEGYEHPSVRMIRRMAEDNGGIVYAKTLADAERYLAYWQQLQASDDPEERQRAAEQLRPKGPIPVADSIAISATYDKRHTPKEARQLRKEYGSVPPRRIRRQRQAEVLARHRASERSPTFARPPADDAIPVHHAGPNPSALTSGTEQQQAAHRVLLSLDLLAVLAPFDPVLTGNIALGLHASGQRLRVHCYAPNLRPFAQAMRERYGGAPGFALWLRRRQGLPALVCQFTASGFRIEVFAQDRPTREQNAFRYTIAAATLLSRAGSKARTAVRQLQEEGLSAEAALAEYFSLPGAPRLFLLALAGGTLSQVDAVLARAEDLRRHCRYCRLVADRTAPGRVYTDPFALITVDPRDFSPRRILLLPRRHSLLLAAFPPLLQIDPLHTRVLDPQYREYVTRLWHALYYVVQKAFPELKTMGMKWDGENTRPQRMQERHAHFYNLLLTEGQNPLIPMPGWYMAAYQGDGPEIPLEEQRKMATRLQAAMVARGLLRA